jgi:hypothetical protein
MWKAPIFGARILIFTGRRPLTDEFLNTKYEQNPTNRSGASEGYIHTCNPTEIEAEGIPKQIFVYSGAENV